MTVAAARAALWEMSRSLFHDEEYANAVIDAFAAAVREEALATRETIRLGDCRGIVDTVNEACTCGGGGPPDCCPACEVWHGIQDMEFHK